MHTRRHQNPLGSVSPFERNILTLLAVVNEPVSRSEWGRLVRAADLRVDGKSASPSWMSAYCKRMSKKRWLVVDTLSSRHSAYSLTPAQAFRCLADANERAALRDLLEAVAVDQGYVDETRWPFLYGAKRDAKFGTDLRVALLRGDAPAALRAVLAVDRYRTTRSERAGTDRWLIDTLGVDPDPEWLRLLGLEYSTRYLHLLVQTLAETLAPLPDSVVRAASQERALALEVAKHLCVLGEVGRARELEVPKAGEDALALLGAFWSGDRQGALRAGREALTKISKRRKYAQLGGIEGVCHALSRVGALHRADGEWDALVSSVVNAKPAKAGFPIAYGALEVFLRSARTGEAVAGRELMSAAGYFAATWAEAPWISVLTVGLVHVWLGVQGEWIERKVAYWLERARESEAPRPIRELSAVLLALRGGTPEGDVLACAYRRREAWEVALDTLETLAQAPVDGARAEAAPPTARLVWEVSLGKRHISIQPRLLKGARAKRGKVVSLSRVLDGKVEGLTDADRRVLSFVDFVQRDPYRKAKVPVLRLRALLGLVDHPSVVRPDGTVLMVTRGEPGLTVESVPGGLALAMQPQGLWNDTLTLEEQSHSHIVVYERTPALERIARAFSGSTLRFPKGAAARLSKVLAGLGSQIRISASADIHIDGEKVEPDSRVVVVLRWDGTVLHVRLRVAPLGVDGLHLRAGVGSATLAGTIDGRALCTERNFVEERARLDFVIDACPTLAGLPQQGGEARAEELFVALEVLVELDRLGDDVVLAWPRGSRLATPELRGAQHMRVRVRQAGDWLAVDAKLPVDEKTVLSFRELLDRRHGRFIELDDSRFIALTEELQRQLDALEGLGKVQKKKGLVTSLTVLPLVEELTRGAGKRSIDTASQERLDALERASRLQPELPRGFGAELREYQREGFVWISRLAEAGLGAVLADDMGLGKTIQTLALLLARRARGPALVIAPTSVASNWIDEATRFAPALKMHALATEDREAVVSGLGPSDVLVCSYGLLVTEAERLQVPVFDTVVFDEAHMLKNSRTKRAQGASRVKARFRLSLSGTPIENHLGELWSLMQVTVPGLLGTEKHFETRFATPMRDGDRERGKQLRALLRPFLLRRTKAQVLDELPARTEVTLRVTPTAEERAFYEALRRRALEQLASSDDDGPGSRLQVLAEITRLRQAAVDPRLLERDGPRGAKVDALVERLLALRAEGHRALVFSQFLGGMRCVRERLEEEGISYLDLDGSTPAKERSRRIAKFQEGATDVFLMSLRAGGIGVNLTAADYVIHLDPWWNPAVEDQATGRAHRIGQERPVTVYRLVTEGTIEERILALHRDKRELAEDLLGNMDRARRLDVSELRALL